MKNGEHVALDFFDAEMEWVDTDDAIERLDVGTFLGRFGDTIAHCTMLGEDGDIFVLDDHSAEDDEAPLRPFWRAADPDQVLVRKRKAEASETSAAALRTALEAAREIVNAIVGENQPARSWACVVQGKIDAALPAKGEG